MKKSLFLFTCLFSLSVLFSCNSDDSSDSSSDNVEHVDQADNDDGSSEDSDITPERKYDLSVLTVECKEMLTAYEALQIDLKAARDEANANPDNIELQEAYYELISRNTTIMSSDTMVECSHGTDFQYALSDLVQKYAE